MIFILKQVIFRFQMLVFGSINWLPHIISLIGSMGLVYLPTFGLKCLNFWSIDNRW